jgi:hypothetical protein
VPKTIGDFLFDNMKIDAYGFAVHTNKETAMVPESLVLDALRNAFRDRFNKSAGETPFIVAMDRPTDLEQFQDTHEQARRASWKAAKEKLGTIDMDGDFGGIYSPKDNSAPLRWAGCSHELLARAYADAMERAGVASTIYKIETDAGNQATLRPIPSPQPDAG